MSSFNFRSKFLKCRLRVFRRSNCSLVFDGEDGRVGSILKAKLIVFDSLLKLRRLLGADLTRAFYRRRTDAKLTGRILDRGFSLLRLEMALVRVLLHGCDPVAHCGLLLQRQVPAVQIAGDRDVDRLGVSTLDPGRRPPVARAARQGQISLD